MKVKKIRNYMDINNLQDIFEEVVDKYKKSREDILKEELEKERRAEELVTNS